MKIIVNGKTCEVPSSVAYERIVEFAGKYSLEGQVFTVTYSRRTPEGQLGGELCPGQFVTAYDGMIFNVADTSRA